MDSAPSICVHVNTASTAKTVSPFSVLDLFPLVSPVKNQSSVLWLKLEEALSVSKTKNKQQTCAVCTQHGNEQGTNDVGQAAARGRVGERERGREGGAIAQQHSHIELKATRQCSLLMAHKQFTAAVTKVCSLR